METSLVLKYKNEQGEIVSCVLNGEEVIIPNFKYEATRMAGAPTISFSIKNAQLLDEFWNDTMFVEFRGEKYYLAHIPSSSLSSEDGLYTHDVEMVSERAALDNVYFYDVVSEDTEDDRPASNSSEVTFHGTINEFVERMNSSLQYAKLQTKNEDGTYSGYRVVIDGDVESESKLVAFKNETMSSVLQTIYQTYNLPYYFIGKEIHIGYESEIISTVFEYGVDDALLSIEKENSNNKVINRCTGYGSSDNLPYFYPNSTPLGNIGVEFTGNEITSATIEDGNKFSGNSLLENTLTYGEIYSNKVNGLSYAKEIYTDGKKEKNELLVPHTDVNGLKNSDSVGSRNIDFNFNINIDTSNETFEGTRRIYIRFACDYEIVEGDANVVETYKNKMFIGINNNLYVNGQMYGRQSNFKTLYTEDRRQRGIELPYNIEAGKIYKFTFFPWFDLGASSYDYEYEYIGGEKGLKGRVECNLKMSAEVDYANNDSYVVGYGWTYTDVKGEQSVQSLSDIGVVVKGNPNVGDTLKFNLISRYPNQGALMPSIFRQTMGKERFYNATNGTYEGYVFPNPYVEGQPKEYIKEFADIKPTITGMLNDEDIPIDRFLDFEYDDDDDNEVEEIDDELIVKHPYFFAKLPKLGFNLFEHASENGEMTISMTSGNCGACKFVIAVDTQQEGKFINTVQVGSNGRPLKDENGNVICGRKYYQPPLASAQPEQNDTTNNEVWIALKKEDETYGMQMPFREKTVDANGDTIETSILPSVEDTFVILNINLPEKFITAAEERLDKAILDYMLENNQEKFSFSIDFSRIYLQENPTILAQLTENARVQIRYDNRIYEQFVSSFTYNVDSSALPEIKVELAEKLELYESPIDRAMTEMGYAFGEMLSALNVPAQCLPYFIRKDVEDTAYRKITFREGAEFGRYESGALGSGGAISIDGNGNSIAEFDYLNIRKKATFTELTIQELKNIGGQLILSPAAMKCSRAMKLEDGNYRCYFEKSNDVGDEVLQEFVVGDLARCQTLNLKYSRYYWREVVGVGDDYIDLSATSCDPSVTNDEPLAGDTIVSLGNVSDITRQSAIMLSAYGTNSPSMTQYAGIDSFTLEGKMVTKFSDGENVVTGKMTILPNSEGATNLTDLKVGGDNLLFNSGFSGDYMPIDLSANTSLDSTTEMYSSRLAGWSTPFGGVTVQESASSKSGYEVVLANGQITQYLDISVIKGDEFVLSFYAKGSRVVTYFGISEMITTTLTDTFQKYVIPIITKVGTKRPLIKLSGTCTIYDLQLERGTIATDWAVSPLDNNKELAEVQSMHYLKKAISEGKTEIVGGLVLSNIVKVGEHEEGEFKRETGGMSGYWATDNDVAFWAGGSMSKAIKTAQLYKNDASYQPTQAELAEMAKFVVTHGGRAILNDIILRGYIYAEGGHFGSLNIGKYTNACGITDEYESLYSVKETSLNDESDGHSHLYRDVVKINENSLVFESSHESNFSCIRGNKVVIDSSHYFDNDNQSLIFAEVGEDSSTKAIKAIGDVEISGVIENYNNVVYHTQSTQKVVSQSGVKVLVANDAYNNYRLGFAKNGASVEFYVLAGGTVYIDGGYQNKIYYDGTLTVIHSNGYDLLRVENAESNLLIKATYFNNLEGYTTNTHGYFITITKSV